MADSATAIINGMDVIASGTLIKLQNDDLSILPFKGEDYRIDIDILFFDPDSGERHKNIFRMVPLPGDENGNKLIIRKAFKNDLYMSTSEPWNFATDDEFTYLSTFVVNTFGTADKYTVILNFNILREKR